MTDLELCIQNNEGMDEDMSNRIPLAKRMALIEANEPILKFIYNLGGMILTKQLHELLALVAYSSNIDNTKAVAEMIKNDVLIKKQAFLSRNNMLILSTTVVSYFTGEDTKNINQISTTDKAILNSIIKVEILMNNLHHIQDYYQKVNISADELKYFLDTQMSTFMIRQKDINDYYRWLTDTFGEDFWCQSFYDDVAVLKVQKAMQKQNLAKYQDIEIDPEDKKIYEELCWVKENCNLSSEQYKQQYFNLSNLIASSCDINYIYLENPYKLVADVVIYDNGSLIDTSRIAELISHTYLCLKRYVASYQVKVYLNVNVECLNQETLDAVKKECNTKAEDNYGYRECTRLISQMYNFGCRYPDSTDNIQVFYHSLSITEKYGIESK